MALPQNDLWKSKVAVTLIDTMKNLAILNCTTLLEGV